MAVESGSVKDTTQAEVRKSKLKFNLNFAENVKHCTLIFSEFTTLTFIILSICLVVYNNRRSRGNPHQFTDSAAHRSPQPGYMPHRLWSHLLRRAALVQKSGQKADALYLSGQWSQLSGVGWVQDGGKNSRGLSTEGGEGGIMMIVTLILM